MRLAHIGRAVLAGEIGDSGWETGFAEIRLTVGRPLERNLLALSMGTWVAALTSWVFPPLSTSFGDRLAATICSTLAVLEYINYYHRQLQHFDHAADFKRLLTGKGFRKSQMAIDLCRYRLQR